MKDGWLHSADAGYFTEEGHLVCIDRVKDLMELSNGTKFSPLFIENKLKFCPYIVEAVVVGHQKNFISGLICIDFKHTGKWAEEHNIPYTTYTDLSSKPEIYELIEKEVYQVNKTLPKEMQIRKFLLLYKELDADDQELTRTRKVRRTFVNEKYKKEIDAIYG
ncbi:MAG: long-chain fatty acid--CoA ligase, partial [Desulfobacteraceae bacterium]|nr:long-chain fatty acid--CoA ligase [Desulfobacteraceae bacterium]